MDEKSSMVLPMQPITYGSCDGVRPLNSGVDDPVEALIRHLKSFLIDAGGSAILFPGGKKKNSGWCGGWKTEEPELPRGTAHFIPYSFKKSLKRLIGKAETVLLEGPLDDHNMDRARQYGLCEVEDGLFFDRLTRIR